MEQPFGSLSINFNKIKVLNNEMLKASKIKKYILYNVSIKKEIQIPATFFISPGQTVNFQRVQVLVKGRGLIPSIIKST